MSKAKQNFIIRLEDAAGNMVDFERWPYKKVETCIRDMVDMYRMYDRLFMPKLDKAYRVVAYSTPDGAHMEAPVWSVSVEEFRKMIEKRREEVNHE